MSSNDMNNPILPQHPISVPSPAEAVKAVEPSKQTAVGGKAHPLTQSSIGTMQSEWSVLLDQAKNLTPPLTQPASQQNIGTVIENSLSALSTIGMDSAAPSKSKESNWLQQLELQQELSLAVETGEQSNAAPSSQAAQNQNGLAAFYSVQGQINSTQLNLMQAETSWIYQLNQLSMNQLNSLTDESNKISSMQTELNNDITQIGNLNANISYTNNLGGNLLWLDKDTYNILTSSNFNKDFWKDFKKDDNSCYDAVQDAMNGYDAKDNAWTDQASLMLVPDVQKALENPQVAALFEQYATPDQISQWNQISAQWNTMYPQYENASATIAADQSQINVLQTQVNELQGPDGAIAQATNSFNTALQQMGITNVNPDNVQQFVAILQTMDRLKNAISHMGDLSGENGLAIFTAVKDAMTNVNQKIITLSSQDVQQMDDYNIDAANNLQVLNKELNAVQASMNDTQENLASLQSAAAALQITVAAETVTAAATCWIPVVGEVAGATLAATMVSLAGVEAAIGADSMQIAQDQEEIAGINQKMTNTMANAQFTEQTASSQTASITQLSKNLQEWVKNSNQVYANVSNAVSA